MCSFLLFPMTMIGSVSGETVCKIASYIPAQSEMPLLARWLFLMEVFPRPLEVMRGPSFRLIPPESLFILPTRVLSIPRAHLLVSQTQFCPRGAAFSNFDILPHSFLTSTQRFFSEENHVLPFCYGSTCAITFENDGSGRSKYVPLEEPHFPFRHQSPVFLAYYKSFSRSYAIIYLRPSIYPVLSM